MVTLNSNSPACRSLRTLAGVDSASTTQHDCVDSIRCVYEPIQLSHFPRNGFHNGITTERIDCAGKILFNYDMIVRYVCDVATCGVDDGFYMYASCDTNPTSFF